MQVPQSWSTYINAETHEIGQIDRVGTAYLTGF
jgi:hypothetical protein